MKKDHYSQLIDWFETDVIDMSNVELQLLLSELNKLGFRDEEIMVENFIIHICALKNICAYNNISNAN
jgi:hypothetical protein